MLIIPTYNEGAATWVSRVRISAGDESILFVDDNSPDGTADRIRSIQGNDPHIHLLVRPGKAGYGSACREAMEKVLSEGLADHITQFDADPVHDMTAGFVGYQAAVLRKIELDQISSEGAHSLVSRENLKCRDMRWGRWAWCG
jgi:glycosyltransferase involved in cell wall biosynthesis